MSSPTDPTSSTSSTTPMSSAASAPTTRWSDERWYAEDAAVLAGVEKLRFFPQVTASGDGAVLTTPEGREVLDLSASWTATGLGHGHPAVASAVAAAVAAPAGGSVLSGTHPDAILLARELLDLVPTTGADRRVYLGHAGTDANDVAVRAVRHATGRQRIVAFERGYHGGLGRSMAVSGLHIAAGATPDPDLVLVPYPDPFRPWTGDADTLLEHTLAAVEEQLATRDVAGVVVEPIQSDGGVVLPPDGFLAGLRELTERHGTLLVVDEVKVGLGRTGHFMAHHRDGILPDLVTVGKALGSGLPLSATIGPASALDSPAASALMTTIGNPVSCAAGRAVLGLLRDGSLAAGAVARGEQIRSLLQEYADSTRPGAAHVGDVRGRGLVIGLELVRAGSGVGADQGVPGSLEPDAALTARAVFAGWQRGVIAYPVRDNVIEITPPLTITPEQAQQAVERLTGALDAAARGEVSEEDVAAYSGW